MRERVNSRRGYGKIGREVAIKRAEEKSISDILGKLLGKSKHPICHCIAET